MAVAYMALGARSLLFDLSCSSTRASRIILHLVRIFQDCDVVDMSLDAPILLVAMKWCLELLYLADFRIRTFFFSCTPTHVRITWIALSAEA